MIKNRRDAESAEKEEERISLNNSGTNGNHITSLQRFLLEEKGLKKLDFLFSFPLLGRVRFPKYKIIVGGD
jgi:hypothetical protein